MARAAKPDPGSVGDYRHDAKRKNIPEAGLAAQGRIEERPKLRYAYDPHLPPVLRFDPTGRADRLPELLEEARSRPLTDDEARLLAEALRSHQPWLEWSGKQEAREFAVDPVALNIHERVAAKAVLAAAGRQDVQRSLFADDDLGYRERVQFYGHDVDWANRLILGDSLQVMASLVEREGMAGKVQMIYVDPPYGIKFASNFQPLVGKKDVSDRPSDLTREPEVIRAYRDTWFLGIHSYLEYLRNRLSICRELMNDTGSIFLQISSENLHRVRAVMDDVFGCDQFVAQIAFQKTGGMASDLVSDTVDYLLWYGRSKSLIKFKRLFQERKSGDTNLDRYDLIEEPNGSYRRLSGHELSGDDVAERSRRLQHTSLVSDGQSSPPRPLEFRGQNYCPKSGSHWKTNHTGMVRLAEADRVVQTGTGVRYKRYADDFSVVALTDQWGSTQIGTERIYAVQTAATVIERCLLMTTDPGDLVLDPTSGSGTTAYVAEKWGRRWIAIDTSRVANAIARQRLLTAAFDWYELRDPEAGIGGGLVYKTVPHVTLKSIAQNQALDPVFARHQPILDARLADLNAVLAAVPADLRPRLAAKLEAKRRAEGVRAVTDADRRRWLLPKEPWQEWEVPFDADPDWPEPLRAALVAYRQAWRAKMDEVNDVIARSAEQEELVDQPIPVKGISRVSGPFTVESVLPLETGLDDAPSPVDGPDEDLDTFAGTGNDGLDYPPPSLGWRPAECRGLRRPDDQPAPQGRRALPRQQDGRLRSARPGGRRRHPRRGDVAA